MEKKATLAVAITFFSQHIERKSILTMCKQKLSSAPSWPGARNTKNIVFLRRNEVFSSFLAGGFLDRPTRVIVFYCRILKLFPFGRKIRFIL
ncbi:MAG: hypothetical protein AABW53_01545, partial [Nanoarchaeota archaeon]